MRHDNGEDEVVAAPSGTNAPSAKLVVLLLVVAALGIFVFQNADDAPVQFLWFDGQWPVWVVIGVSVVAGAVIDRLGSWQWRRTRRDDD